MKRFYCFSGSGHETEDVVSVAVYQIIAALGHDISSTEGLIPIPVKPKMWTRTLLLS